MSEPRLVVEIILNFDGLVVRDKGDVNGDNFMCTGGCSFRSAKPAGIEANDPGASDANAAHLRRNAATFVRARG
jgi:hypothetical protein